MDKKSDKVKKYRFCKMFIGPILLLVFAIVGTSVWPLSIKTVETIASDDFWGPTIVLLIGPWFLTIYAMVICWPVVTISETGIKHSFLGLFRNQITWEELYEIRLLPCLPGGCYLFFSTKSLEGMDYKKAGKQKGQIQAMCSIKLLKAIRQFTDKEIVNLPEDMASELTPDKEQPTDTKE